MLAVYVSLNVFLGYSDATFRFLFFSLLFVMAGLFRWESVSEYALYRIQHKF